MFEHYKQPLLSRQGFILRMLYCAGISLIILSATIGTGIFSFRCLENLAWIDAFLNSVLIMTGLGIVSIINTASGKIFTSIYAIFSSLAFFGVIVILVAPILHRLLHHFHLDIDGELDHCSTLAARSTLLMEEGRVKGSGTLPGRNDNAH